MTPVATMDRRQRLMLDAINDDPGGLDHPIWAELGIDPIPPISAEERWLIDQASLIEDPAAADAFAGIKVWDRDANGNYYKLWTLGGPGAPRPPTKPSAGSGTVVTPVER